jgi:hypothetical protein
MLTDQKMFDGVRIRVVPGANGANRSVWRHRGVAAWRNTLLTRQ